MFDILEKIVGYKQEVETVIRSHAKAKDKTSMANAMNLSRSGITSKVAYIYCPKYMLWTYGRWCNVDRNWQ